jgi:hypothetical protein
MTVTENGWPMMAAPGAITEKWVVAESWAACGAIAIDSESVRPEMKASSEADTLPRAKLTSYEEMLHVDEFIDGKLDTKRLSPRAAIPFGEARPVMSAAFSGAPVVASYNPTDPTVPIPSLAYVAVSTKR